MTWPSNTSVQRPKAVHLGVELVQAVAKQTIQRWMNGGQYLKVWVEYALDSKGKPNTSGDK